MKLLALDLASATFFPAYSQFRWKSWLPQEARYPCQTGKNPRRNVSAWITSSTYTGTLGGLMSLAEQTREEAGLGTAATLPSIAEVLSLVGTGAGGDILMTLGKRPLRTGQLIAALPQFSTRSVYRYAGKLEEKGLIERRGEAGSPTTVVLSLSEPGRNLYRLLRSFESWECMTLLGEMWDCGFIAELSRGARSLTQLSNAMPDMSFHQVNRRVSLFVDAGLLTRTPAGRLKHYELTAQGRRCMTMVAAIGRWRHRHPDGDGASGLSTTEMVTILRAALPLTRLPQHAGRCIALGVASAMDDGGHRSMEMLHAAVDGEGKICADEADEGSADGSATATINTWFAALLDGNRGRIRVRGNLQLVDSCLTQLYDVLWEEA